MVERSFKVKAKDTPTLAHGAAIDQMLRTLAKAKNKSAFVGHEPELSAVYAEMGLTAQSFKKGEIRCLKVKKKDGERAYRLLWSLRK